MDNQIDNILQQIESLEISEQSSIYEYLRRKEAETLGIKLATMPDIANAEYSVFDDRKVDKVTPKVLDIRKRRYILFVHYYSNIDRSDDEMINFIQLSNPILSYVQAVRDLNNVKLVIGNMPRARKELHRYAVIEMQKKAYKKAMDAGNIDAMVAAANGYGRAANLEKDDADGINWDEINPPNFEPTHDIQALGEGWVPKENIESDIERLKKKFMTDDIEDAKLA